MSSPSNEPQPITVSVVVATYNRARYLRGALDSIFKQTRPPEEVIVADDGSTDNTAEVVARYGARLCYHKLARNQGKAAALNLTIPNARGSHIWIFDDDDVALNDALQSHVDFLLAHPEVDFSYSTNYRYSGDGDIWQRNEWIAKTIPDWPADRFLICTMQGIHTLLQGMLIPKHCLLEVGLFDPALRRAQDTELLIKLAQRFKAGNIQKPTFVLRDHDGPRGPNTHRHPAARRSALQLQYQQQIFRKLRKALSLYSFVPHEPGKTIPELTETEHGEALIQRSCIMLRQGLADEALQDLADGLCRLKAAGSPLIWVNVPLSMALDVNPRRFAHPFELTLNLGKTLESAGCTSLTFAIARGLYWTFRRCAQQHLWHEATIAAAMLALITLRYPSKVLKHSGEVAE